MSTGLGCMLFEYLPDQWYYAYEIGTYEDVINWLEEAEAYGPFATQDEAAEHLLANHQNPGGFSTLHYAADRMSDQVLERLVAEAPANMAWLHGSGRRR
jgi:hypothetical protein